jgi:hypothetical protein
MMLPALETPCRLLAKACRKPVSEAEPLLPPRALTRLAKLVWSAESAELAVVLLAELLPLALLLDELDSV